MKTTYLVWKDPNCNGINPDWQELNGREFFAFIKMPENKGRHFIKLFSVSEDGSDGDIVMEATETAYDDWKQEKNRSDYLRRCNEGYTVLSYHAMETEDGCYGEELLPDETVNVEDDCFFMMDKKVLKTALARLTPDEYRLIAYLYLSDGKGTVRGYSELTGIPVMTIQDRKTRILKKLKKVFEK
jgi:DNA-directed RNA polymerase sigma subunit (sigma70/sigma32)